MPSPLTRESILDRRSRLILVIFCRIETALRSNISRWKLPLQVHIFFYLLSCIFFSHFGWGPNMMSHNLHSFWFHQSHWQNSWRHTWFFIYQLHHHNICQRGVFTSFSSPIWNGNHHWCWFQTYFCSIYLWEKIEGILIDWSGLWLGLVPICTGSWKIGRLGYSLLIESFFAFIFSILHVFLLNFFVNSPRLELEV